MAGIGRHSILPTGGAIVRAFPVGRTRFPVSFPALARIAASCLLFALTAATPGLATENAAQALTIARGDDGLTVAVWEDHKSPIVTVDVWLNVGSAVETDTTWGLAHNFEHMFYRGTDKRGPRQNRDEIINIGGMTSAATWYDYTHFYNSVSSDHLDVALDTLTDSLMNLKLPDTDIVTERSVINEEQKQRMDDPSLYPEEEMMARLFPEGRYGKRVIGTPESISGYTRKDFVSYYKDYYTPANTTVVIAGDVAPADAIALAQKKLTGWANSGKKFQPEQPPSAFPGYAESSDTGSFPASLACIGFRVPGFKHPDRYALEVAEHLLVTGRAAKLKNLVGNGIASVYGGYQQYRNIGTFVLYVSPDQTIGLADAAARTMSALADFASTCPTDAEVAAAKNDLSLAVRFYQAGTRERAALLGEAITYGNPRYYLDYEDNLSKVTAVDVKRVLNTYFAKNNCRILYLGPQAGGASNANTALDAALRELPAGASFDYSKTLYTDEVKPVTGAGAPSPSASGGMKSVVLPDGMKVILVNLPASDLCSMGLFLPGGSASDPPGKEGLTQLTLSMLEYGSAAIKRNDIVNTIASLGDSFSTGVARDYSQVTITTTADLSQNALAFLKGLLKRPSFDSAYIDDARNSQLAQIAGVAGEIVSVGQESFRQAAYNGTAYAQPPLGSPESLAAMSAQDVSSHWERMAAPRGAVLIFVGDIAAAGLSDPAKAIGQLVYGAGEPFAAPEVPDGSGLHGAYQVNLARQQNLLIIGARAGGAAALGTAVSAAGGANALTGKSLPVELSDYGSTMVLASLLNLRVFREIVYDKGLAYRSVAEYAPFRQAGLFMLTLGYSPANETQVFTAVSDQFNRLTSTPPSDDELSGVKGFVTGYQALSLELPGDKLLRYGQWEMTGAGFDFLPAFMAAVGVVKPSDVTAEAQKLLSSDRMLQIVVKG